MHKIQFEGLDLNRGGPNGSAIVRFRISNNEDTLIATIPVIVGAQNDGIEGMLARAHASLAEAMREWTTELDRMRDFYAKQAARYIPQD